MDNQVKLSHVYTPIDERSKGYASNLIYTLTNELLEKELIPLLYTDYNYKPSNKAYINAGYEDTGILINFTCSKNK
jgi:predicted GNAT family acetyltransferase